MAVEVDGCGGGGGCGGSLRQWGWDDLRGGGWGRDGGWSEGAVRNFYGHLDGVADEVDEGGEGGG